MKQDTEQLKKKTVSELLVEFGQIYQDYLAETGAYDGASLWSFARAREIRDSLHLISSDEIKRKAYREIYKMGLNYQAQVARMQLGEEESALILDDFLKDISSLTQSKEGGE